ncbi:MAG TPA: chloride channel protein [Gammaproteobacteria bacterium]|jgi:H+/Cl- antiporter ClcA|nr:chloride channel protein [Gammaproteobacteria bacterium]
MTAPSLLRQKLEHWKDALFITLSDSEAKLQPAILGLVVGLLTGVIIVAFRLLIEVVQKLILPEAGIENFEQLGGVMRFCLPIITGILIGWLFMAQGSGSLTVGVVHVMERLSNFHGNLPLRPFFLQFIGAALALVGGHSVGREGPSIHLGAAAGSLLGQRMQVPNNTLRLLAGCGTAAAIGASFNTPLAGVIFAMEVVLMEFSIGSFIPVILASVSATSISIAAFGNHPVFTIPPFSLDSLLELPFVVLLGLLTGAVSTLLITASSQTAAKTKEWPFIVRTTLAGIIVAFCGLVFPQVMGIGYDTINGAMLGQFTLWALIGILVFKMIATSAAIGLGIPAGVIGPTLVIGSTLGAIVGYLSITFFPNITSNLGVYSLIGLGAMMAATLQAPLAALLAMLELTNHPEIILPGMLAIVIAELTRSELFKQPSIFKKLLQTRGLDYSATPMSQHLTRIGVASVMDNRFANLPASVSRFKLKEALKQTPIPKWILIDADPQPDTAIPAVELARYLKEGEETETIELAEIPVQRRTVAGIHLRATLHEAEAKMHQAGIQLLYVFDTPAPDFLRIKGVLRKETIESSYRV